MTRSMSLKGGAIGLGLLVLPISSTLGVKFIANNQIKDFALENPPDLDTVTFAFDLLYCGLTEIGQALPLPPIDSYDIVKFKVKEVGTDCGAKKTLRKSKMMGSTSYHSKSASKSTSDSSMPIRFQDKGPEAIKGIFWLTNQSSASSIFSFAETGEGGGVSPGELQNGRFAYKIRVGGESWAGAEKDGVVFTKATDKNYPLDLVYQFKLLEGDLDAPTKFQIIPNGRIPDQCTTLNVGPCFGTGGNRENGELGVLGFEWIQTLTHGAGKTEHSKYKGSVVWKRDSKILGTAGEPDSYEAVQIVDGNGCRIKDAFDDYVKAQTMGPWIQWPAGTPLLPPAIPTTPGINYIRRLREKVQDEDRVCSNDLRESSSSSTDNVGGTGESSSAKGSSSSSY